MGSGRGRDDLKGTEVLRFLIKEFRLFASGSGVFRGVLIEPVGSLCRFCMRRIIYLLFFFEAIGPSQAALRSKGA